GEYANFVSSRLSFVCCFFWLVTKFSSAVGWIYGLDTGGTAAARFPYREEQAAGAWITFAGMALWGARRHWGSLMETASAEERRFFRRMVGLAAACMLLGALMMTAVGIPLLVAAGVI